MQQLFELLEVEGGNEAVATSDTYSVITTGQILEGFDPDDVRKRLISVLRLEPGHAERFFEKPRVLKKGVTRASADKLCGQLAKLGVSAEIQSPAKSVVSQPAEPKRSLPEESALELVQDEAEASQMKDALECPNCRHVQAKSEQCESCGIWFHKFESSVLSAQPDNTPRAIPAAAMQADHSTVVSSDTASEKATLSPAAIAAAVVAALVGAWVWKFVAVAFEFELALIAWGIGGAVGFAAASAGSRGMQAGIVCAVLAFGSIVVGKYWAYEAFADQFQEKVFSVLGVDEEEFYASFEEETEDARVLVPSPWVMMREDFGILDILFAVLGIGTAFRLGSQWE